MNKVNRFAQSISKSPFLWGILGSVGFYALIQAGPLDLPFIKRYFAHHPVEYMETVMFSVGLAALIIKAFDIVAQRAGLRDSLLASVPSTSDPSDQCAALLAHLERLPSRRQGEYYVARVRHALEHIGRRGAADSLDDELKYLSDLDAARLQHGYGLFRVIVWAIPILGFLGTVIGITMALNSFDLQSPDQSMMAEVLKGLGLKFDTTALALTLSMVLMFVHYTVERAENSLLEQVDDHVRRELTDRFPTIPASGEGQVLAMRQMAETMLQATDVLLQRQAELWQAAVDTAAERWAQMSEGASEHVKAAMSSAVAKLTHPAEVLERAVTAAGEVTRLEDALNRNLTALAGAKHFEQTVLSLAAAVNMLSARVETPSMSTPIKLEAVRRTAQAA